MSDSGAQDEQQWQHAHPPSPSSLTELIAGERVSWRECEARHASLRRALEEQSGDTERSLNRLYMLVFALYAGIISVMLGALALVGRSLWHALVNKGILS